VKCDHNGALNASDFERHIKRDTKLVILTHASNICGTIMPIERIGEICKKHNIYYILDSAQSAGVLDKSMKEMNIDALAFTGHKGLLGPQGIGGFIINNSLAENVTPMIEGGTGSLSESELQPDYMPDRFESGTLNIPGIYGLNASLKYLKKTGIKAIRDIEDYLCAQFLAGVTNIKEVHNCGFSHFYDRTAVVSLDFKNYDNSEIAYILDHDFGIMTRVGLHCAPSAHKTLGTFPSGTVRFSFGHFNTLEEVRYTIDCINKALKMV
jgi:selenocysteine lyase/cysteine desulfurase